MRFCPGCILLLFFMYCGISQAQVNTEKLRRADSTNGTFFSAGITLGLDRGNSEFVSAAGGIRADYKRTLNDNFIVVQYEFKESDRGKITNKGFLHLRTMWGVSDLLALEGFGQSEFNEFISLKNRNLIGVGTRWHPLHLGDENGDVSLEIFVGVGVMYEHELYTTQPEDVVHDRLRSTNYLTLNAGLAHNTFVHLITYFQPVLSSPEDFRFSNEAAVEFSISEWLTFSVSSSYRYNSRPVLNVRNFDLQLRNGIRVTLP
ncbi:MAG: DUF481 domain-containing protein [Bacteroidetes bacterium]|nr:DUF481 domain-containing protein [Bacteroidota bacterium]